MYRIIRRDNLAPRVHLFEIYAPKVAEKAQAGQFIILKNGVRGERVPLTLADWDSEKGTVTVVFMEVGLTTSKLALLQAGDSITDFVGPLGLPTHVENYGTVVCVAGGFAVATIMPIARALKKAGNRVISIVGVRSKDLLFWEREVQAHSNKMIVTTDDGSYGQKGLVTAPLASILEDKVSIDRVIAIGPTIMMKSCSNVTSGFGKKTIVSLNPIMVDGTGMCGCCRVTVDGMTRFACVDGPDFDGHAVDWDELMARQKTYKKNESLAMSEWQCQRGSCKENEVTNG